MRRGSARARRESSGSALGGGGVPGLGGGGSFSGRRASNVVNLLAPGGLAKAKGRASLAGGGLMAQASRVPKLHEISQLTSEISGTLFKLSDHQIVKISLAILMY